MKSLDWQSCIHHHRPTLRNSVITKTCIIHRTRSVIIDLLFLPNTNTSIAAELLNRNNFINVNFYDFCLCLWRNQVLWWRHSAVDLFLVVCDHSFKYKIGERGTNIPCTLPIALGTHNPPVFIQLQFFINMWVIIRNECISVSTSETRNNVLKERRRNTHTYTRKMKVMSVMVWNIVGDLKLVVFLV